MEVTKHISHLLFYHECVILPGFGGFISDYQSARIDFKNNSFYPPRKDILFNGQLTRNDGLLINYLSQFEKIEYVEAKNIIEGFVKKSIKKLTEGGKLVFEGIGTLNYDENKIIQFEPDLSSNYLLESYGLSSFHFPAISENHKTEKRVSPVFTNRKPVRPNGKRVLKRVLIATPFILILGLLPFLQNINNKQVKSDKASLNPIEFFSDSMTTGGKTETVETDNTIRITSHSLNSTFDTFIEQKTEESTVVVQHYFIIGGSCRSRIEAQRFAERINQIGLSPFLLNPNKGRYRIALEGFSTKEEALAKLYQYRHRGFSDAWIWKRN
ncbi:MAG: SPOR domain-containing protein [Bacteroidota bacterium]|nr:SPOR domain-containing protein [Bacteroidota bacterium]